MKYLKYVLIVFILITLIGCDQVTKEIAKQKLPGMGTISYLNSLIKLQYAENPGAVLSLGSDLPSQFRIWILSIIPAIVLLFMLVYVFSNKHLSLNAIIAISLMTGGGISNLIDRFAHGFVVDFMIIDLGSYSTGIFNFADVAITCGVCLVVYLYLVSKFHLSVEAAE